MYNYNTFSFDLKSWTISALLNTEICFCQLQLFFYDLQFSKVISYLKMTDCIIKTK